MLTIRLLGEQRLAGASFGTLRASSSRSFDLLAYLILNAGTAQRRSHLAGIFWPDSNEAQARTNLRRELHNLRSLLGELPSLVVEPSSLTWKDDACCDVDVRVFASEQAAALACGSEGDDAGFLKHASAAMAEYRGELMPGSYEDWVLEQREQLNRQCAALCDGAVAAASAAGDLAGAIEFAHRRLRLAPLEESGHRALIGLHAEAGDRAAAVSAYHRCAVVLERELGVRPDAATTALVERLLEPAERDGRQLGSRQAPSAALAGGSADPELVGRTNEVTVLSRSWRRAAGGRPAVVVVAGEPGVGKSRLVAELAAMARADGALVASTRCFAESGRLALAPVADWLRRDPLATTIAGLDAVWREQVERLVPGSTPPADGAQPSELPPGGGHPAMLDAWHRHRFFEGLAQAMLASGRPTVLVLDDLQWCDQETVAWLTFFLRYAKDAPVLVAATLREEPHPDAGVTAALRALRSSADVTEVALSPFDRERTGELAAALLRRSLSATDEALLHAATGGYPLFVVEAARFIQDHPEFRNSLRVDDLRAVLRRRLEEVSPAGRDVAGLAAAVGCDFRLDLLCEASDLDVDALVRAVDELWRRHILKRQRGGYDFTHDLLRHAAYSSVSPAQRWLLHRRLAQAMEVVYAERIDDFAGQLAEQHERGGRQDRALDYLRRAAERADAVFANAEAVRHRRRCLQVVERMPAGRTRDELELEVLQALSAPLNALHGYSSPELQSTLERSAALAEHLGRAETLVRNLVGLFAVRFVQGHNSLAHEIAARALRLAEPASDLSGQAHFAFAGSALSLGMLEVSASHFDLAQGLSPAAVTLLFGTRTVVHAQAWAAHTQWLLGDETDAIARCEEAVSRARAVGHPYSLAVALAYAAITRQLQGDTDSMTAMVDELAELCHRYEFAYYSEWGRVLAGWATGGERGATEIGRGIERLRAIGANARMPYWLSLLGETLASSGRKEDAAAVLDAALAAGSQRDDLWWLPEVLRLRAGLAPPARAAGLLERAVDLAASQSSRTLELRAREALAALGRSSTVRSRAGVAANARRTGPS